VASGNAIRGSRVGAGPMGEAERGEAPVPDLRNLDVYYEIGTELVLENLEFVDEQAYRDRYLEKLREWNAFAAIPHDTRLWTRYMSNDA
jgi:hypothetical protein